MALNETSLRDVLLMEIDRVNGAGGLLGRPLEPVVRDPRSDWMSYRDLAHTMIYEDGVEVMFGCWTSLSRKSVLPVVEEADILLFYPMQYEGEEQSRNIFYLGAPPNQQAIPAVEYLMSPEGGAFDRFFLIGTDFIYPRTTNSFLKSFLRAKGLPDASFPEAYYPFEHTDWSTTTESLRNFRAGGRGVVLSTLNGISKQSFYRAVRLSGFSPADLPIMDFSISEAELQVLDPIDVAGHFGCWGYFMSHPAPENAAFIETWHRYTKDPKRPVYDPMEAAVVGFRMWCNAVTEAGTTETRTVRQFMYGQSVKSLTGGNCVMGVNHHVNMTLFVGRAGTDRQFEIVWQAPRPVFGDPWAATQLIADATATTAQRDLLDALPTPLIVLGLDGSVRYRSTSTHDYFGATIAPQHLRALLDIADHIPFQQFRSSQTTLPEIALNDNYGRRRNLTVSARRMVFAGEEAYLLSFSDVTHVREVEAQLRLLNTELHRLATTDPLTGLTNRREFLSAVHNELRRMQRHARPAAVFMLDIDHFKRLNDLYGHDVGDRALVEVARQVRQMLRSHDVFARLGGEEFAAFLPETDIDSALQTAERVRASVAALRLTVDHQPIGFTCSIGVTILDPLADTPESALKRADAALYAAKAEGRDRVVRAAARV
jgi:urea transport system substrate-binding protein